MEPGKLVPNMSTPKPRPDLNSRIDDKRLKTFDADQGEFGLQWLNVVHCRNLGLKLDDQQLRLSIGVRHGANICVAHTCHCDEELNGRVYTVFLATKVVVASHMLLSILSKSRQGNLSTCSESSSRVECAELMANALTVLP